VKKKGKGKGTSGVKQIQLRNMKQNSSERGVFPRSSRGRKGRDRVNDMKENHLGAKLWVCRETTLLYKTPERV